MIRIGWASFGWWTCGNGGNSLGKFPPGMDFRSPSRGSTGSPATWKLCGVLRSTWRSSSRLATTRSWTNSCSVSPLPAQAKPVPLEPQVYYKIKSSFHITCSSPANCFTHVSLSVLQLYLNQCPNCRYWGVFRNRQSYLHLEGI